MPRSGPAPHLRHLIFWYFTGLLCIFALGSFLITRDLVTSLADHVFLDDVQDSANEIAAHFESLLNEKRREIEVIAAASELRHVHEDPDAARLFLRRVQETSPRYALIGFVSDTGEFLTTSNRLLEGANVANRSYFIEGRKGIYIGDAHDAILLAEALGGPDYVPRFFDISAPVRSDGRVIGVLAAHLFTQWAQDIGEYGQQRMTSRYRQMAIAVLAADGTSIFARSNLPNSGAPRANVTAEAAIKGIDRNGSKAWTVRILVPASAALNLLPEQLNQHVLAAFGLLVLTGAGVFLFAGKIASPIERLAATLVSNEPLRMPTGKSSREAEDIAAAVALGLQPDAIEVKGDRGKS